jgi:hemin uptake protein HemP
MRSTGASPDAPVSSYLIFEVSMVRSAPPSPLQRKRLYVAIGTLLGLASGIAHAQQSVEDLSAPVTGHAPAIVITGIVNESVPTSQPRVGHVLRVDADVTDADNDSITSRTYRWLRDDTEIANTVRYTPVADDAGKTLVVEVTANTDANTSDPAIGTAQFDVAIVDNRAPTADLMSIVGTIQVGVQVSGAYRFQDLDDDLEGPSTFKWFRADTVDGPKSEINGQTSRNYTLRVADEGKFIFFEVTPHSSTGEPRIGTPNMIGTTVAVAGADGVAPTATGLAINGTTEVNSILTGDYNFDDADGDNEGTSTFKWYRADTAGGTRTEIVGETGQTYTLRIADEGKFVFFEVTPRSATGEPKAGSPVSIGTTGSIAAANGAAPTATGLTINGTAEVNSTLTGDYNFDDADGDQEGTSTFKWYRADTQAGARTEIVGETGLSYTLQIADEGKFVFFEVTPRSATGEPKAGNPSSIATSGSIAAANGAAPTATGLAITGTAEVNATLTGDYDFDDADGDQEGASTFKWYRADTAGGARTEIAGETGPSYTLRIADEGKFVFFEVTPRSATGEPKVGNPAIIATTGAIAAANGVAPTANNVAITGNIEVNSTITGSYDFDDDDGDQEGTSTFKWYRADTASGTRTEIVGETGQTYTLRIADEGKFVFFEVTPRSATGEPKVGNPASIATSGSVAAANGAAPTATGLAITGTAEVNSTLTGDYNFDDADGDQEGTSTFKWYRADTEAGARTEIVGETGLSYTLRIADEGKFVFFEVTPRSATGEPKVGNPASIATSGSIAAANGAAPTATGLAITGTTEVNSTLTGDYNFDDADGDQEGTSTFKWYRADTETGTRTEIVGETGSTYVLKIADEGKFVFFEVTPRSATGEPKAGNPTSIGTSSLIAAANGAAPTATGLAINGTAEVNSTLTGDYDFDDADGDQEGTSTFKWYRADTEAGTRTEIVGETGLTYTLRNVDEGKFVFFEVTPRSATGEPKAGNPASIGTTAAIAAANGAAPTVNNVIIEGTIRVGSVINGSYLFDDVDGDDEGASAFKWYRADDADGTNRTEIPGETARNYTLHRDDEGKFVFFEVTPQSATGLPRIGDLAGAVTATAVAPLHGSAPRINRPVINGEMKVGSEVSVAYNFTDVDGDREGDSIIEWATYKTGFASVVFHRGPVGSSKKVTLPPMTEGKGIVVTVFPKSATGTPRDGMDDWMHNNYVDVVPKEGSAPVANEVAIAGTVKVGSALNGGYQFSDDDNDAEGGTTYKWYRADTIDGERAEIVGQTGQSYVLQIADEGKFVFFEVSPRAQTGLPKAGTPVLAITAGAVAAAHGAAPTAGSLVINGVVEVNSTITGAYRFNDDDGDDEGASTFKWYRADTVDGARTELTGETGPSYTLTAADEGKFIFFEVTPRSKTGEPKVGVPVIIGTALAVVTDNAPPTAAGLNLKGELDHGQTVEAEWAYADPDGDFEGKHVYQWYRADNAAGTGKVAIPGAVGKTYMQTGADQGKHIGVEVTPVSADGQEGAMISTFAGKELRYRDTRNTLWGALRTITVNNRSGNAPSNLRVGVWRNSGGPDDQATALLNLRGPNGAMYQLGLGPEGGQMAFYTVDVSAQSANGDWTLTGEFKEGVTGSTIGQFTLEFNP